MNMTSGMRLHPILHDKFTDPVQSITGAIADIADSREISDMVRRVNRLFPDASLKHLKKIRRTDDGICQILLGKYDLVQQNRPKLLSLSIHNTKPCQIPARPPLTRQQFDQCKQLWPTSFHEEKYVAKCLQGQRFTHTEVSSIRQVVDQLMSRRDKSGCGVTLITDKDVIIAGESDDTERHPLHHSAIRAVDSVARKERAESDSGGYVCTGMDAFMSRECCLMCAMALLHSRIRRIFFLTDHQPHPHACPPDAPFSRMKLHVNENLNHAFEVWFEDSNVSTLMQLKSSAQKSIKTKIVEQFPLIEGHMDDILTKKDSARIIKCHEHIEIVINGSGEHLFFKQRDGPYIPSLKLVHKYPFICPLMQVDQGAITFVLSGANIMCPGLTSKGANMTAGLPVGQVVTVVAEGKEHALAVGVLRMTPEEITRINKGVAIENMHYLNDGLWRLKPQK